MSELETDLRLASREGSDADISHKWELSGRFRRNKTGDRKTSSVWKRWMNAKRLTWQLGEELSERHVLETARKTSKEEVTINSECSTELELKEGRCLSKGHSYYFMSWSCQGLPGCFVISGFSNGEKLRRWSYFKLACLSERLTEKKERRGP